ncbi:class I adenylate-forming enzyme family protein [Rhodococcus sp. (in: high G+C Gram-positive bacteria)]|jgi:acyl-CoA synthetase (AMP-forming)/AMP-acid ligase II|uniref:class I adenylate-forming enzyme family protein n=1 Tax=Rhodococcus sp. TaxID=1831 RepID=UPI002579C373|nr:class I adenylate-forming enzyme family protein [Rhodococcus sp. (in: high G+C Gram-positive bacteria)]MBQ7805744.1 acyl--CoA ligase [Rhodococcus sp. (in: high G+C Gram-positive bacteria)]
MNLATKFSHVASVYPNRVAIEDAHESVTYGDLDTLSARIASYLGDEGIVAGERVGVYMSNSARYLVVALGIWKAGAVLVPFNLGLPRGPLRHAAEDSGVRMIFADSAAVTRLSADLVGLDVVDALVDMGRSAQSPAKATYDLAVSAPPITAIVPRMDDDNAFLMYTSGSTGKPKGVQQTHRNTTSVVEATIDTWNLDDSERAVICTPFFHVGGMQLCALPMLFSGAFLRVLPRWNAAAWRDAAIAIDATFTALVPTMVVDVANQLEDQPIVLDSMKVCAIGGSVLPVGPVSRFIDATGITNAINIYGQTEQSGVSICERSGEQERPWAIGRPMEQIVQWRLTDPGSNDVLDSATDVVGELQVRGDAVTPGYWNLPETNESKYVDGWFRTGDLVRVDSDGTMHYVERIDEMIISGGENIYPQLIENHLASNPDVAEVAVIGTYHERWMQQVTAIIVPRSESVTTGDILAYCASHPDLQGLQKPRRIEFIDSLPRTGNNKIDRPQLKRTFQ